MRNGAVIPAGRTTLAQGPGQRDWARKDPDLRWLHGEERFWELVGGRAD